MSTSATLEHGDPQIEVDLMLELKMTVQKLKKALPRFGKGIQIEMGAVNNRLLKQLKTPNVEGVLLDPTLKLIFMLCRYERLLNRSKASKTRGQVKNFQFDNFDQLSQTMARFSVVSDQLLVEIEPCIDRFVVPLLHLSCQPTP
ncbi:hypothetical protein FRC09_005243 [Ceratobasidium sp. 395]|nr:hypothetical protein FRC09_005243 [Ceratobasidium sp. 395]